MDLESVLIEQVLLQPSIQPSAATDKKRIKIDGQEENQLSLKVRSLLILSLMIIGFLLGAAEAGVFDKEVGIAIMLIVVMVGFAFITRLKCPNCSRRLSKKIPVGALLLLYFAKDKCPYCGEPI